MENIKIDGPNGDVHEYEPFQVIYRKVLPADARDRTPPDLFATALTGGPHEGETATGFSAFTAMSNLDQKIYHDYRAHLGMVKE